MTHNKITIASDLLRRASLRTEADMLRESFPEFASRAWAEVDPAPLVRGWFVDLLWGELEAWGKDNPGYQKLILAVPPGSSKSLSASVLLQAWMWARDPTFSLLAYCSTQDLAIRDNLRMRDLVTSDWYRERFCANWELHTSQRQKKRFRNSAMGERYGIGGLNRPTGWRGNCILIDDPVDANPRKPPRPEDYENAYKAVQYLLRTRKNQQDAKGVKALLIMQRLAEADPVGMLLEREPSLWKTVCFDALYDPAMPHRHPADPRRTPGEVLLPEMGQTKEALEADKIALGTDTFNAQYQQQPSVAGGMIVAPQWLQRWQDEDEWDDCPYTIISWDCAFKGESTSSWVVGSVWKVDTPDDINRRRYYLVDIVREHLDYASTKRAIERLALRWPEVDYVVIEDKANGPAAISELRHRIPQVVGFSPNPYGGKEQRLRAVSSVFEQGRVWVPEASDEHPWVDDYIAELTRFPKSPGNQSDQVDSTTQCMLGCTYHLSEWREAVKGKDVKIFWMG